MGTLVVLIRSRFSWLSFGGGAPMIAAVVDAKFLKHLTVSKGVHKSSRTRVVGFDRKSVGAVSSVMALETTAACVVPR
jgi:hypothetical protein